MRVKGWKVKKATLDSAIINLALSLFALCMATFISPWPSPFCRFWCMLWCTLNDRQDGKSILSSFSLISWAQSFSLSLHKQNSVFTQLYINNILPGKLCVISSLLQSQIGHKDVIVKINYNSFSKTKSFNFTAKWGVGLSFISAPSQTHSVIRMKSLPQK